jgi:hypothetical protein
VRVESAVAEELFVQVVQDGGGLAHVDMSSRDT